MGYGQIQRKFYIKTEWSSSQIGEERAPSRRRFHQQTHSPARSVFFILDMLIEILD